MKSVNLLLKILTWYCFFTAFIQSKTVRRSKHKRSKANDSLSEINNASSCEEYVNKELERLYAYFNRDPILILREITARNKEGLSPAAREYYDNKEKKLKARKNYLRDVVDNFNEEINFSRWLFRGKFVEEVSRVWKNDKKLCTTYDYPELHLSNCEKFCEYCYGNKMASYKESEKGSQLYRCCCIK